MIDNHYDIQYILAVAEVIDLTTCLVSIRTVLTFRITLMIDSRYSGIVL